MFRDNVELYDHTNTDLPESLISDALERPEIERAIKDGFDAWVIETAQEYFDTSFWNDETWSEWKDKVWDVI